MMITDAELGPEPLDDFELRNLELELRTGGSLNVRHLLRAVLELQRLRSATPSWKRLSTWRLWPMPDPYRNYDAWRTWHPMHDEEDLDAEPCDCGNDKPEGHKRCRGCQADYAAGVAEDLQDE